MTVEETDVVLVVLVVGLVVMVEVTVVLVVTLVVRVVVGVESEHPVNVPSRYEVTTLFKAEAESEHLIASTGSGDPCTSPPATHVKLPFDPKRALKTIEFSLSTEDSHSASTPDGTPRIINGIPEMTTQSRPIVAEHSVPTKSK